MEKGNNVFTYYETFIYWLVYLPWYLWPKKRLIFNQPWRIFMYLIEREKYNMADIYYWQGSGIGQFSYGLLMLIAKIVNSIAARKLCFSWNLRKRSKNKGQVFLEQKNNSDGLSGGIVTYHHDSLLLPVISGTRTIPKWCRNSATLVSSKKWFRLAGHLIKS